MDKQGWAEKLMVRLYKAKFTQTLWNSYDPKLALRGWILKNFNWALWFYNMRQTGDEHELFLEICQCLAEMISEKANDFDVLIGVEMAGVPLIGGVPWPLAGLGVKTRFGYTRPLPRKVRTLEDAYNLLNSGNLEGYGEKNFVEARLRDGDRVAIIDDMATGLESKQIARYIVQWVAEQQGIELGDCSKIFYLLNRGAGNIQKGLDFQNQPAKYRPASLEVNYVIEFDSALQLLKGVMRESEYEAVREYQNNPARFQDEGEQKRIFAQVAKDLGLTA